MVAGVWSTSDCVAAGCGTVVKVWTPNDPSSEIKIFEGTSVYSIDFSRNNKVLAVAGDKGQVVVYSNKPQPTGERTVGKFPNMPESGIDAITCVRFSSNDAHLAAGCKNGAVRIWSLRAKEDQRIVSGLVGSCTSLAINHSMEMLAMASSSGQVLLHDFRTGVKWKSLVRGGGSSPAVGCLGFSRIAPALLAAANTGGQLLVWDMDRQEMTDELTAHKGGVTGLSFSEANPDLLISCGSDGALKCTDRRTQQAVWSVASRQPFTALSAKHDGQLLAVGNSSGSVLVHDVRSVTQTIAVQQFSDTSCPVSVVRWQHLHAPRSSRASSSATGSVSAAVGPAVPASSAFTAAASAATAGGWQQQAAQSHRAPGAPAAAEPVVGGSGAAVAAAAGWPRSPVRGAGLVSETSSTSVSASVDFGMRALSPVQVYGSPDSDAAGGITSTAAAGGGGVLHTPELAAGLATPADSLASAGPGAPNFMFTPGIGLGHLGAGSTPMLTATPDLTPISNPAAALAAAAVVPPPQVAAVPELPPAAPQAAVQQATGSLSRRNSGVGLDSSKPAPPAEAAAAAAPGGRGAAGSTRAPAPLPAAAATGSNAGIAAAGGGGLASRGSASRNSSSSSLSAAAAASRGGARPVSAPGAGTSVTGAGSRRATRGSDPDVAGAAGTGSRPGTGPPSPGPAAAAGALGSAGCAAADAGRAGEGVASRPSSAAGGTVGGAAAAGGVPVCGLREDVFKAYVDQQMAELRQDVKSLHLDMLRQFHQAQMDLVSVVDGLAQRQDQLAEAVTELTATVAGLRSTKQHQAAGIMMPWI